MTKLPTIDRRSWLALWAQKRRRARVPKAPASSLTITLEGNMITIVPTGTPPSGAFWLEQSADGVTNWQPWQDQLASVLTVDMTGLDSGFYRVCYEDNEGNSIAPFSNAVQWVAPSVGITLNGSTLSITVTGTFPGALMAVFWNDADNSPRDEIDDIPPTQTTYDLTGQAAGWFYIGKINGDGSPGTPMSNGVYYPG